MDCRQMQSSWAAQLIRYGQSRRRTSTDASLEIRHKVDSVHMRCSATAMQVTKALVALPACATPSAQVISSNVARFLTWYPTALQDNANLRLQEDQTVVRRFWLASLVSA